MGQGIGIGARVSDRRVELTAALGLLCLYLAVMSGHSLSIDGLVMWRQALALTYHHSWSLVPPIWWGGDISSSYRGVGASLQYVPTLVLFFWMSAHVPVQAGATYDFRLFYDDVLYLVAGAPVWAVLAAATSYLVGLTANALGLSRRQALWAMLFFGVGSPALAASRGDWPQPLVAFCWIAGVLAILRFNATGARRWIAVAAAAVLYAVLARPLEGSLLLPGLLLLLLPRWRRNIGAGFVLGAAWALAVAITLLLNAVRFGSPLNFGYSGEAWTTPPWVGVPAALLSPGRGVLWECPAIVMAVVGAALLWRSARRIEAVALAGLPLVLFVEASMYFDWVGGWDWGFRYFQPALPLVAVLAAVGTGALHGRAGAVVPAALVGIGLVWNIPAVATDLLAGYGQTYATPDSNWRLDAYPPIGAWRFLQRVFPSSTGAGGVDIVWFRATRVAGIAALIPFAALLAAAGWLWKTVFRVPETAC